MLCRTLIVSLVLFPVVGSGAPADEKEQAAIAAIESFGGSVRKIAANTDDQEVQFYLSDQKVTDEALKPLRDVTNLVWLNLRGTDITDAGLVHLESLTKLTRLHLERTGIGDEGLQHLSGLTNLRYLNLYGTKVTDAGCEKLRTLNKLEKLYLWQTQVTEAGVKKLNESLPDLEIVLGTELPAPQPEPKSDEAKKE